ncbi:MAG: hypothetical protein WC735_03265 [Candidatus Paceibacterota bacterium]|jgi:DNA repair exonuclease SbcCD ATPase subunit
MNKLSLIGGGVVFALVLAFGVYFFMHGDKYNDLVTQKNMLQSDLAIAKNKLNKEKETLDTMTDDLESEFYLAATFQDQMRKASGIVEETDFMFKDASGSNPELIVKNPLKNILINDERKNINLLLEEWRKKTDILLIKTIDVNEREKIQKEMQTIKEFLEDLSEIIESLTPADSGLSQLQIDIYLSQLPPVEAIEEVLVSLETAIENSNNPQTPPTSPSNIPSVTPEDVGNQQEVVEQVEDEVDSIKEKLTQVEQEIQQSTPNPPPPTPTSPTTPPVTTNPNPENQNTNNGNNTNNPEVPRNIPNTRQGIIVQPGSPRLIQGTDPY